MHKPIPFHRVLEGFTCTRRAFLSQEEPLVEMPATVLDYASTQLRNITECDGTLELLEAPLLWVWKTKEHSSLVVLDDDPLFESDDNMVMLLLQYALHRYDFTSGCWIQTVQKRLFTEVRSPMYAEALQQTVQDLQEALHSPATPPILEDTSKCLHCPVVERCLPFVTDVSTPKPTLLPPKDSLTPLIVILERGKLRKSKGEVVVENKKGRLVQNARLQDISAIILFGKATVTTPLLHECAKREIPVHYHDPDGWFQGSFRPVGGHNVMARIRQYQCAMDLPTCLEIVRGIVSTKIHNQRTLLMRNTTDIAPDIPKQLMELKRKAKQALSIDSLRGIEGQAARVYFQHFDHMLQTEEPTFSFKGRHRRPPTDPVNALLSFGYACLYREMTDAIYQVGLDAHLGFLHVPTSGRAALALDLMEDFRPILVDMMVVSLLNRNHLSPEDFTQEGRAVLLGPKAKALFLKHFHNRLNREIKHAQLGVRMSYRRALQTQVQLLVQAMNQMDVFYPGYLIS